MVGTLALSENGNSSLTTIQALHRWVWFSPVPTGGLLGA